MIFKMRCSNRYCRKRTSFKRHPNNYVRAPKCPSCEGTQWGLDSYRTRLGAKENKLCYCGHVTYTKGYPINPHRWGCKGCFNREEAELVLLAQGKLTPTGNQDDCIF